MHHVAKGYHGEQIALLASYFSPQKNQIDFFGEIQNMA